MVRAILIFGSGWVLVGLTDAACGGGIVPLGLQPDGGGYIPESGVEGGIHTGACPDAAIWAGTTFTNDGAECPGAVLGVPCIPSVENNAAFTGFPLNEVGLERSPEPYWPTSAVCVVDHFRGRVTCPYGQNAMGQGARGGSPCTTMAGQPVMGAVAPQCLDRPASKAVFVSCRCANAQGRTDDGNPYCTCPTTMACIQLVADIGTSDASTNDFAGAYCLPPGAPGSPGAVTFNAACSASCDPITAPCP